MLLELSIHHIALIDALTIDFQKGFNVLTGETGAGKSIVVGAVSLMLGERADRDLLQTGAKRGSVEALFAIADQREVQALLRELELETDGDSLSIAREITDTGRTVCRIAGVSVPLATLRRVTTLLVDLHGQHAHQSLLNVARHLGFLDDFGDAAHQELIARVQHAYQQWHATERKIAQARGDAQEHARRLDMLQYQLQELNAAHLRPDEEKTLEEMRNKARNAERIQDALGKCYALTVSGAGRGLGALDALRQSSAALSNISDFGEAFATLQTRMEDVMYTLEDIVDTLGDLREEMACDPKVLEKAEERLDLLSSLRRKYGATTREMLVYRDRVAEELEKMTHTDTQLEQWEKDLETQHQMLLASAATLSAARHTLAERFAHCMLAQLADLGMGQSRFEVRFERASVMSSQGFETAEFFIAPNPGEPLKPLARIASGGEMSRIMLAMKNIAADHAEIPVAIFDEIDTGISGRMAQVVAEKMAAIAHSRQVICVTHLPQITAMADAHYVVEKRTDGVVTRTYVDPLDEAGRCRELARMLGGADPGSPSSLTHARTLLMDAKKLKQARFLPNSINPIGE